MEEIKKWYLKKEVILVRHHPFKRHKSISGTSHPDAGKQLNQWNSNISSFPEHTPITVRYVSSTRKIAPYISLLWTSVLPGEITKEALRKRTFTGLCSSCQEIKRWLCSAEIGLWGSTSATNNARLATEVRTDSSCVEPVSSIGWVSYRKG